MTNHGTFDEDSARRIARVVRRAEREGRPSRTARRSTIQAQPRHFQISDVQYGDYLVCNPAFVNSSGALEADTTETWNIAKPYHLRQTPFDGNTVNTIDYTYSTPQAREAEDTNNETEDQVVLPAYVQQSTAAALAWITAVYIPAGTGVVVNDEQLHWQEWTPHRIWCQDNS